MAIIYLLTTFFLLSSLLATLTHNNKDILVPQRNLNAHKLLFITVPAFIIGLYFVAYRPFTSGGDTSSYLNTFSHLNSIATARADGQLYYGNTEILFWPTQALLKTFLSPRGWLIANYLIVVYLTYIAYKKICKHVQISPLIFTLVFLTYFAVYSGNALRQSYALPLSAIAFTYAYERKNLKFAIFTLLAIFYHWSAIILLTTPAFIRIPNKTKYYIWLPIGALALSTFSYQFAGNLVQALNFAPVTSKFDLYFQEGRISHFGQVWETLNFWLSIFIYYAVVITTRGKNNYECVKKYLLTFMTFVLFSIFTADVSERYMVGCIFIIPISIAIIFKEMKISTVYKNIAYVLTFSIMSILVYTRESAMITLGIQP